MTTATLTLPVAETATSRSVARRTDANDQKFLSFCLGREEYGLQILVVREIIGLIDITPLPKTPDYVKGVINLRGKIIPVIELRSKFGMPTVKYTQETCVIVVEVTIPGGNSAFQLGVIVDSVREVLNISKSNIEPPPSFGCQIPLSFILGMGKVDNKVVILLDINNIGAVSELSRISDAAGDGSFSSGENPGLAIATHVSAQD